MIKAQDYTFTLELKGKTYEQINIQGRTIDLDNPILIKGKKVKENRWSFSVSDSVFDKILFYDFRYIDGDYDSAKKVSYRLKLNSILNGDTVSTGTFYLDRSIKEIQGTYMYCDTIDGVYLPNRGLGSICMDEYLIPYKKNTELAIQGEYPQFSFFYSDKESDKNKIYDDYLAEYISAVQKYPDSKYLLYYAFHNRLRYRSKEDLQKVYHVFSRKNRNSVCGKELYEFIFTATDFSNTGLPELLFRKKELIVQDSSKYNLVVFSASWCGPCHEQIPLLKKLYFDLPGLLITYISMDEIGTVKQWESLIRKEKIPWRSLLSVGNVQYIREKYSAHAIPRALLVYPGGKEMKVLEIRKEEDRMLLYELMKK